MTDCIATPLVFSSQKSRNIQADFQGDQLTSDAGSWNLSPRDPWKEMVLTKNILVVIHKIYGH